MSITLMAQCWPMQMPPTAKAVLMSLADHANDEGYCWPSLGTIATRTCFSERAVQNAVRWLEEHGALMANRCNGRHTTYIVSPAGYRADDFDDGEEGEPDDEDRDDEDRDDDDFDPGSSCTPAAGAPPQQMRLTPAANAGDPRSRCVPPPQQVPSNRQGIIKEPSGNRLRAKKSPQQAARSAALAEGFARFWEAYPLKRSKKKAQQSWQVLQPDAALQAQIMAGLERARAHPQWRADGGRYVPHAATWLNQERWSDEPAPACSAQPQRDEWLLPGGA